MKPNENARELASKISAFVNPMGNEHEMLELARAITNDHPTLQQKTGAMMLTCIMLWAEKHEKKWFDDRNEALCRIASTLAREMRKDDLIYIKKNKEGEEAIVLPLI